MANKTGFIKNKLKILKIEEMKKAKLNAYQVGLVSKNGEYQKMLLAGTYWFWKNEQVYVYDITKQFIAPIELNILLQDEALANILQVVDVKDTDIALQYENS